MIDGTGFCNVSKWNLLGSLCLATVVVVLCLPATAYGQLVFHGAAIQKTCNQPKVSCDSNADCTDGDVCNGLEQCDVAGNGNTLECFIRVTYIDEALDTVTLKEAWDIVDPGGLNTRVPGTGNLPISAVSGNTTCTVAGTLPCDIGPDTGSGEGVVTFEQSTYNIIGTEPDPLVDQGHVIVSDQCDSATGGCSMLDNDLPFPNSTDWDVGCSPGTPLNCNDGDVCTDDSCDSILGCQNVDNSASCNDGDVCTDDSCDSILGCQNVDNSASCNDGDVCTDDSCDSILGCQNVDNSASCNDGDVCTDDSCDSILGCQNVDNSASCNDGDVCTDDSCDSILGCQNVDNSAS